MHKVPAADLVPGMQLARTLHDDRGDVLLARGVELTASYIGAIVQRGFEGIFVADGFADDIEPVDVISDELRRAIVGRVKSVYEIALQATRPVRELAAREGAHVLARTMITFDRRMEKQVNALVALVDAMLDEILDKHTVAGISALKSHSNYTFQHSVEVAVYGVLLGKQLAFERSYLGELALGCLLHDIGKLYIEERLLAKPGKLSHHEFTQVKKHSMLGFQMVRQFPLASPRPSHIVLQHHERQDGEGYPNKLFGTNRLIRSDRERFDAQRINLLAEIATVADVYSALCSDRPYRAAMPVPKVLRTLQERAGSHLNREAVQAFATLIPLYPVGTRVRLQGGTYDGYLGVVSKCFALKYDRPRVRLVLDRDGQRCGDDAELDLRKLPDSVELVTLPESGGSLEEQQVAERSTSKRLVSV